MVDHAQAIKRGQTAQRKVGKHLFVALEHRVIDSEAFADLKHSSVRVQLAIARQLTRDNNGHLQATYSWCQRYGIGSDNTLTDAVSDLIAHGFIYRTKSHGASGVWAKYAVTWLPVKKSDGLFLAGFKMFAWRDWVMPDKKSLPQKLRITHRKNCELRGETTAETAGSLTSETATYESCCHGSSANAPHRIGKRKQNHRTPSYFSPYLIHRQTTADRGFLRARQCH